jgi:hypothetical protein
LSATTRGLSAVDDEVGLGHLLERGPECRHQVGRKFLDEPDGVGEEQLTTGRKLQLARGRVEGRKELLLGAHAGVRERVEQRRLAGVGVADDGRRLQLCPASTGALLVALVADLLDLTVEVTDALADAAPLDLDLLLTETTARPHPTSPTTNLAVVGVGTDQPRQEVMQACGLDLKPAFVRPRVLGKDLEDDLRPIQDSGLDLELEVSLLARAQVLVADDNVEATLELHVAQ